MNSTIFVHYTSYLITQKRKKSQQTRIHTHTLSHHKHMQTHTLSRSQNHEAIIYELKSRKIQSICIIPYIIFIVFFLLHLSSFFWVHRNAISLISWCLYSLLIVYRLKSFGLGVFISRLLFLHSMYIVRCFRAGNFVFVFFIDFHNAVQFPFYFFLFFFKCFYFMDSFECVLHVLRLNDMSPFHFPHRHYGCIYTRWPQ